MKHWMPFLAGALMTAPAFAKDLDTESVAQDVNIMRGILATALSGGSDRHGPWSDDSIEAWYLARQGVVFRVNTRRLRDDSPFGHRFELNTEYLDSVGDMVDSIMDSVGDLEGVEAPEPPEAPEAPQAYAFSTSSAAPVVIASGKSDAVSEADRKALRDLAEDMRNKARAVRDKAREMERLERDHGANNASALEAARKALDKARSELTAVRDQQRKQLAALRSQQEARWNEQLGALETKAIQALCNYGGSLKSIPKDENVSLMMTGAVKVGRDRKDRVYVFSRKDLSDCQADKLNLEQLRAKAVSYNF